MQITLGGIAGFCKHEKHNKLVVEINRPLKEVFAYVIDPRNTPSWLDFVVKEETSEWPVRVGTIYRNQNKAGEWSEYRMTTFVPDQMFVLSKLDGSYSVQYTLRPLSDNTTELEYVETVERGEIAAPFTPDVLRKLKTVLEDKN